MEDNEAIATEIGSILDARTLKHKASEAFSHPESRQVIDRILRSQVRSLAVVSQFPGEGKTFVSTMLAAGISRFASRRVLLIDSVSSGKSVQALPDGGGDLLIDPLYTSRVDTVVARNIYEHRKRNTEVSDSLRPTSAGAEADVSDFDLLAFIASNLGSYGLVLVDTCALTSVSSETFHPAIIASHVEGVLVVLSPQGMQRTALAALRGALNREGIRPIGFVVTAGGPCGQ